MLHQLDQHSNDLGAVELIASRPPGVIAEVIEDLEMARGEDELNPVFNRWGFGRSRDNLGRWIRWLYILGLAEDVIPTSGEWILAEGLRFHAE
jgi:hypothetical protein